MEVSITLTVQEVNALLGMLGQMPNSSGTYPLLIKIKEQGQAQLQQTEVVPPAPAPV